MLSSFKLGLWIFVSFYLVVSSITFVRFLARVSLAFHNRKLTKFFLCVSHELIDIVEGFSQLIDICYKCIVNLVESWEKWLDKEVARQEFYWVAAKVLEKMNKGKKK